MLSASPVTVDSSPTPLTSSDTENTRMMVIYRSTINDRPILSATIWGKALKRAKKYYLTDTVFEFYGLLAHGDYKLFQDICREPPCLHHLLPDKKSAMSLNLRKRRHDFNLPLCFLSALKDVFYSALFIFIFVKCCDDICSSH